jgi:hypothetical protein
VREGGVMTAPAKPIQRGVLHVFLQINEAVFKREASFQHAPDSSRCKQISRPNFLRGEGRDQHFCKFLKSFDNFALQFPDNDSEGSDSEGSISRNKSQRFM